MNIRLANDNDILEIEQIYNDIHTLEENGKLSTGWIRNVYPTKDTIKQSVIDKDMYVIEEKSKIIASGRINDKQMEEYKLGCWSKELSEDKVLVLHTLTVSPKEGQKGYARKFIDFYNSLAKEKGCISLRIDTNEKNVNARSMYKKLGFIEVGIVPCVFNGIKGVNLVLLERDVI